MTPMHDTTPAAPRPDNVVDLDEWRRLRRSIRVMVGDIAPDFDDDPPPIAS